MKYNGLKKDLNIFAKFAFIYETEIKKLGNVNEFSKLSERSVMFFDEQIQKVTRYAKVKNNKWPKKQGITLIFTKEKVKILDFCRHLRNSFVHAQLKKGNQKLEIHDKGRKGIVTAKGYLTYSSVKNFIIQIIEDYEKIEKDTKEQSNEN